jgi:two-component system nitrogen regulation sensor histidine kinase GlnL
VQEFCKGLHLKQVFYLQDNHSNHAQQALKSSENPCVIIRSRVRYGQPVNGIIHQTVCGIEIEDNGPGIPKDIHDQVFFPMVSLKETGSGLGLTIAQDIIRIHGGGITFKSEPGKTSFSINIPLRIKNEESKIA